MKPAYRVPSMREIAEVRGTNGYQVVSTFSGCGGACLGFEMDGYEILYANEFVPAARETYAANHPGVILDGRDIRTVTGTEILEAINKRPGDLDDLEGSPPCASFSTAGSREKAWGRTKKYSDTVQRADDLFYEYSRILGELQPKVFTAENVSGLVKGKAVGYFKEILTDLRTRGYVVEAKVLDASWLGVPQARQRLIFIGVRNDIADANKLRPVFPKPYRYQYAIRDVLDLQTQITADTETQYDLRLGDHAIAAEWDKLYPGQSSQRYFNLVRPIEDQPVPTVTAANNRRGVAGITHPHQRRKFTLEEIRKLSSFPADFVLTGTYAQRWERIGRSVPPFMSRAIAETIRTEILDKIRN